MVVSFKVWILPSVGSPLRSYLIDRLWSHVNTLAFYRHRELGRISDSVRIRTWIRHASGELCLSLDPPEYL